MTLCIRLVTEKMWATSRKCVFYGIFKNTTKHQKIFSENFFEMQPNTWKHFLFRKIAFLENIYFSEILLHEPNAALVHEFEVGIANSYSFVMGDDLFFFFFWWKINSHCVSRPWTSLLEQKLAENFSCLCKDEEVDELAT